jgi:hypothetical protein
MMKKQFQFGAAAFAVCMPLFAAAQSPRTHVDKGAAPAPALRYTSAFTDYKPFQNLKPSDWRGLNETVGKSSGPGAHGMGADMSIPSQAAPPASGQTAPPSPAHGGKP